MSYHPLTTLVVHGDAEPPVFRLSITGQPVIELIPDGDFRLTLGNHNDQVSYLRVLSDRADQLANDIEDEQARQARLADGAA